MTTIVVPLDGSVLAERALRPACSIAARLEHARVLLVSCAPDDIDVAQHQLDDRTALYSEVVDVETRLVGSGPPADAILATVAAEVVPPDEDLESARRPFRNRQVEAATARLDKLSARLHTPTTAARTEVLHGTPSRSITGFAERLPAALIAMATHGRSGIARITMGSVATDVVRHAPCPVLITRPTDNQACIDE